MPDCEKFDVQLNQWSPIASLNIPRREAAGAAHLNSVFVFGGNSGRKFLDSVEMYDVLTDKWTLLEAQLSVARDHLAAACVDNCVYLFGGKNPVKINETSKITECFDFTTLQFTQVPSLHIRLHSLAAASVVLTEHQVRTYR